MAQLITLPDCAKQLLEFIYPTVDWSRVTFYDGLPGWILASSPDAVGITFPDPVSFSGYRVYLKNTDFCIDTGDPDDPINTLVHEAFHVQQYMGKNGWGYGVGLLRPSMFGYQACALLSGYDNPFEQAADAHENRFLAFHQNRLKICDCTSGVPRLSAAARDALIGLRTESGCADSIIVRKPRIPSNVWGPWWKVFIGYVGATILIPFSIIISAVLYLVSLFKR